MASDSDTEDRNFYWMTRIVSEPLRDVLWEILITHIPQSDIVVKIKSHHEKLLKRDQLEKIYNKAKGQYTTKTDWDITNLYPLLRNICPKLQAPTSGWGVQPNRKDTTLSDDIERIRFIRNDFYHHHATEARLANEKYAEIFEKIRMIIGRIDKTMGTTFERRLTELDTLKLNQRQIKDFRIQLEEKQEYCKTTGDEVSGRISDLELTQTKTSKHVHEVDSRLQYVEKVTISIPDSSCSRLQSSTFENDRAKYWDYMPPDIKIGYYDCIVLYCEEDRIQAQEFRDHLVADIKLETHGPVRAVLYDCDELISLSGQRFEHLGLAVSRCTYVFIYLTEQFLNERVCNVSGESCLMNWVDDTNDQTFVRPVYTKKRTEYRHKLMGFNALNGINYYENNQSYLNNVSSLITDRLGIRIQRDEEHRVKQKQWIEQKKRDDADQEQRRQLDILAAETETQQHPLIFQDGGLAPATTCMSPTSMTSPTPGGRPQFDTPASNEAIVQATRSNSVSADAGDPREVHNNAILNSLPAERQQLIGQVVLSNNVQNPQQQLSSTPVATAARQQTILAGRDVGLPDQATFDQTMMNNNNNFSSNIPDVNDLSLKSYNAEEGNSSHAAVACSLSSKSAAARPKLKLLPRSVKEPVHEPVHTERNASIFGTGKPREGADDEPDTRSRTTREHSDGSGNK